MRYYVVADDGNKYGPADIASLNSWIQEGRLVPTTLLEEEGSGARVAASAVSGLNFPAPAPNPGPGPGGISGPGPGFANPPGPANPYSAGYANSYQAVPEGGNTETIISWICGGLGFVCCCCPLPIIGIILAIIGKNKGNRNGQAALIFNVVILVVSIILGLVVGPTFRQGFNQGFERSMREQRSINTSNPPAFPANP